VVASIQESDMGIRAKSVLIPLMESSQAETGNLARFLPSLSTPSYNTPFFKTNAALSFPFGHVSFGRQGCLGVYSPITFT
jgi:hypothetical protein